MEKAKAKVIESLTKLISERLHDQYFICRNKVVTVIVREYDGSSSWTVYPKYYIRYRDGSDITLDDDNIRMLVRKLKTLPVVSKVVLRRPMQIKVLVTQRTSRVKRTLLNVLDANEFKIDTK